VRTFLNTTLGAGITPDLALPILEIGGKEILTASGSLVFTSLAVEYQQTVRDWIAVRGRLNVIGRLANETGALLTQGVTLLSGFELGWQFRCLQTERVYLSASLVVSNTEMTDVNLQRFIDGILADGTVTPQNKLTQSTPVFRGSGGLACAYALSEAVGIIVSGDLLYGESANRERPDQWYYRIGAAVDVDLTTLTETPLGFAAGLQNGSANAIDMETTSAANSLFAYVGYTGSRDFALGMDVLYHNIPIQNFDSKQAFVSVSVDIRLFF
jgi:hypothetical protein